MAAKYVKIGKGVGFVLSLHSFCKFFYLIFLIIIMVYLASFTIYVVNGSSNEFAMNIDIFPFSLLCLLCVYYWRLRRRLIKLLTEGQFTRGRVVEMDSNYRFLERNKITAYFGGAVSFRDQYGLERTESIIFITRRDRLEACRRWRADGRSVGLLYLPDRKDIAVTDLLLE